MMNGNQRFSHYLREMRILLCKNNNRKTPKPPILAKNVPVYLTILQDKDVSKRMNMQDVVEQL